MGGGGKDSSSSSRVKFAKYLEERHKNFLNLSYDYVLSLKDNSPIANLTMTDPDIAFFGIDYSIGEFPSLYDMFGKFMAGLDVEVLYNQVVSNSVSNNIIDDYVKNEASLLEDDIQANALTELKVGMRDLNAVLSSQFLTAKAMVYDSKIKAINKLDTSLRTHMIDIGSQRWTTHLEWNKTVIAMYTDMVKTWVAGKQDYIITEQKLRTDNALWPFIIFDYYRHCLGALTGSPATTKQQQKPSAIAAVAGGALAGASLASMITPATVSATGGMAAGTIAGLPIGPVGAVVGGLLGLAASL